MNIININIFLSIFLILTSGTSQAMVPMIGPPQEICILNIPNTHLEWKEINRKISPKECLVERIPLNQNIKNWSTLVSMQYIDNSILNIKSIYTIVNNIRTTTKEAYPGNKVTWNYIDKKDSSVIYEWILHKPYNDIPIQHEISRVFLTKKGFHRVGFTHQFTIMNSEEREKYIKLLRESISIKSLEEAKNNQQSLSVLDKLRNSLDLGSHFNEWKDIDTYTFDVGFKASTSIPPDQINNTYLSECLEIITMPNFHEDPIEFFVQKEKRILLEKSNKQLEFTIIENKDNEVFYSFSYPKDHLHVTGVVRSFTTPYGYYSICYKKGLPERLNDNEINLWKDRIASIKY